MSKSLNLYLGATAGIGVMLLAAYNFADRNVAGFPDRARSLTALSAPIPEPEAPVRAAGKAAQAADEAPAGGLIAAAQADEGAAGQRFGLGRAALPEEVAAWDLDVRPDGTGLPAGSGNAQSGEPIYENNCASCHGSFAEGVGNWPTLAGGQGTLADEDPVKTVGSYWPYASTVWDYVHRSMPFGAAQTLSVDETYAIVAYILYSNDLIDDEYELNQDSLAALAMPNADGFIVDDRAETEYSQWRTEPCMENCKDSVEVTMRATVLDVTPDEADEAPAEMDESQAVATAQPEEEAAAAPAEEAAPEAAAAAIDPDLAAQGEKVFRKCKACHKVDGGKATGPHLDGVFGREIGGVDGFKYSGAMAGMGGVWNEETLAAFLAKPRDYVKGTKMAFAGLRKEEEIVAVTEYLKSISQ